jgi:glutathione peroxidase
LQALPETETIAVAVLYLEVAAAVRLIANVARDPYAFRLEFRNKSVGVVDPDVRVPGSSLRINDYVGSTPFAQDESGRRIAAYIVWAYYRAPLPTMQKTNFWSKQMKKYVALLALAVLLITSVCLALTWEGSATSNEDAKMTEKSVLDFTMKGIDGNDVKLDTYSGKVLLLVNVASKCGYTPQYKGLESVYEKYKDQGLVVMGFPANNFFWQEPGTDQEIKTFCTTKYNVTFPMFAKISVKGSKIHPLYRYLTSKETNPEFAGSISWNFNKFLVDRSGKVVARFSSKDEPEGEKLVQAIEQALKQ